MSFKQFSLLYQTVILEHNKNPKNFGKINNACCHFDGQNRMCGDFISIYLSLETLNEKGKKISNISFEGQGCAILKASASLMTELLQGKSVSDTQSLFEDFIRLTSGELDFCESLNQLNIFSGLSAFQSRLQCARLPWDTLFKGLSKCQ